MTMEEISERYHIPIEILYKYENWGLSTVKKVMGEWKYNECDLERISLIMTLYEIGFNTNEVETYMNLLLEENNTDVKRMKLLNDKRNLALDEIHFYEKQLEYLDYLRHEIQEKQLKEKKKNK